ncbi:hypothetical protein JFK97_04090 [Chromobacterium phragmitis]|uniref:hypothetical protein n=1 Tax=Chromobacterium amazonense TaxID=1382803 RepID=UPI0021B76741|nr:hypothetical protein [Chromobacterium amazonense]MBM2883560.1 hypothetical protein [Chromobacterium amazonense]
MPARIALAWAAEEVALKSMPCRMIFSDCLAIENMHGSHSLSHEPCRIFRKNVDVSEFDQLRSIYDISRTISLLKMEAQSRSQALKLPNLLLRLFHIAEAI